jgi:hypothetical protein
MLPRERTLRAERRRGRGAQLFRQLAQHRLGARMHDATTSEDDGPVRALEQARGLGDQLGSRRESPWRDR